jgi:hypothetical protein
MIETPEIRFSDWICWDMRSYLNGLEHPGVYVLAIFEDDPPTQVNPETREIIYVGETCSNSLRKRLEQFNRSAFLGKKVHSGGRTYRRIIGGSGQHLFVSIISANWLDDITRPQYIRYLERKLIWDYTARWDQPPKCNRK